VPPDYRSLMAKITAVVRRHNRKPGGTLTYETSEEIAHYWQLLTREQQTSLHDQAEKNYEYLPALLERLLRDRRL